MSNLHETTQAVRRARLDWSGDLGTAFDEFVAREVLAVLGSKLDTAKTQHQGTLEHARERLRERLHEGLICPCCGQHAQLYRRGLNAGMAKALIQIHNHAGLRWTRVQDIPGGPRGGDYAKLRFWRLLESSAERAEDGNSAGYWRVTQLGADFIYERVKVPSHVGAFNNKVYPLQRRPTRIGIREALGNRFNYEELLRGVA